MQRRMIRRGHRRENRKSEKKQGSEMEYRNDRQGWCRDIEKGRKGSLVILEASGVGLGALASAALVAAGVALAFALEATPHAHLRVCSNTRVVKTALGSK
jgi:hypothetical protein